MPFICDSYRNITTKIRSMHFNYRFLLLLISLETTMSHVRRALLYLRFYIHKFLQLPHQLMTALYIWSPTLWHAVYHKPAVYILCRGHGVIINSNHVCNFRATNIFFNIYTWLLIAKRQNIITLSELKEKLTSSTSKSYIRQ